MQLIRSSPAGFSLASLLAVTVAGSAAAQARVEEERVHTSPSSAIAAEACVRSSDGAWYVAGSVHVNVGPIGFAYLPNAPFLQRLDDDGQLVWSDALPFETQSEQRIALAAGPGGEAYVAYRQADDGPRVVRYAADGTRTWTSDPAPVAGAGIVPGALVVTPGGEVLGVWQGTSIGTGVALWDASGALLAQTTLLAGGLEGFGAATPGGGLAVAGRTGPASAIAFALDATGTLAWSDTWNDFSLVAGIAVGPAGEVAVAGRSSAFLTVAWLRSYAPTGAFQWQSTRTGAPPHAWEAVAFDVWGGLVVAGWTGGTDAGDGLVARYDASGALVWERSWNGSADRRDLLTRLAVLPSGDVAAAGRSFQTGVHTAYYEVEGRLVVAGWRRDGTPAWEVESATSGTDLETTAALCVGPTGSVVSCGSIQLNDFVDPGYHPGGVHWLAVRPQAGAFCFGDALTAACPCGNVSADGAQEGCANTTGAGATLRDAGLASLAADTLALTVDGTPPASVCLLLQADVAGGPAFAGDGLSCIGGNVLRMSAVQAVGGTASFPPPASASISARSAARGDPLSPGATRLYQVLHRNQAAAFCPVPQGGLFNTSAALSISWVP